jgi:hypothetical protein
MFRLSILQIVFPITLETVETSIFHQGSKAGDENSEGISVRRSLSS